MLNHSVTGDLGEELGFLCTYSAGICNKVHSILTFSEQFFHLIHNNGLRGGERPELDEKLQGTTAKPIGLVEIAPCRPGREGDHEARFDLFR